MTKTPRRSLHRWLGISSLALLMGVLTACSDPRDDEGAIIERSTVSIWDLRVGDCVVQNLEELYGEELQNIELVPCSDEHRYEVYDSFDLPDGPFPGQDEADEAAGLGCDERFEDYVGISVWDSQYEVLFFNPTRETWEQMDDREVLCLAHNFGELIDGTLEGAER